MGQLSTLQPCSLRLCCILVDRMVWNKGTREHLLRTSLNMSRCRRHLPLNPASLAPCLPLVLQVELPHTTLTYRSLQLVPSSKMQGWRSEYMAQYKQKSASQYRGYSTLSSRTGQWQ